MSSGTSTPSSSDPAGKRAGAADAAIPIVLVLADDLIWSSRLTSIVGRAGGAARTVAGKAALAQALAGPAARPALVIVDLGGRRYDGVAAIAAAHAAGVPVIAIGPHEDVALRRRALAAGARRVYANSKMHADGPSLVRAWLAPDAVAAG